MDVVGHVDAAVSVCYYCVGSPHDDQLNVYYSLILSEIHKVFLNEYLGFLFLTLYLAFSQSLKLHPQLAGGSLNHLVKLAYNDAS